MSLENDSDNYEYMGGNDREKPEPRLYLLYF